MTTMNNPGYAIASLLQSGDTQYPADTPNQIKEDIDSVMFPSHRAEVKTAARDEEKARMEREKATREAFGTSVTISMAEINRLKTLAEMLLALENGRKVYANTHSQAENLETTVPEGKLRIERTKKPMKAYVLEGGSREARLKDVYDYRVILVANCPEDEFDICINSDYQSGFPAKERKAVRVDSRVKDFNGNFYWRSSFSDLDPTAQVLLRIANGCTEGMSPATVAFRERLVGGPMPEFETAARLLIRVIKDKHPVAIEP